MKRIPIGAITVTVASRSELVRAIVALLQDAGRTASRVQYVNAHIHNLARKQPALAAALNSGWVTAADGASIVWAARQLGSALPERCNMTEVFRGFLHEAPPLGARALLLGAPEGVAAEALPALEARGVVQVVATASGYATEEDYRLLLEQHRDVDLVLLGMGTPKSEQLALLAESIVSKAVVWHIGGGTILFLAGRMREAPRWMREHGLQWVHRLLCEPRRMWRRYLIGNWSFVFAVKHAARLQRRRGGAS